MTSAEREGVPEAMERLRMNLRRVIRGKDAELDLVILGLISGSHILLEDVPGVGKTTLAKALAASIDGEFRRVQFTPDLLPTDILGGSIYNPKEGSFSFRKGPVFTNILLADEINRASPRTQSALLEAMAEGQVTVEGQRFALVQPFCVIATQNPVEYHGTYPLPEAQLDRFGLRFALGYPPAEEEAGILSSHDRGTPLESISAALALEDVLELRRLVREVHVDPDVSRYIVALLEASRSQTRLSLGVSTRGGMALYRHAQARAFMEGREAVYPDDVKTVAVVTLSHRLILETKTKYAGISKEQVIRDLLAEVKVPV